MKNTRQFFHLLSYLQYPLMLLALYHMGKPYFDGSLGNADQINLFLESMNNMLIFMGLGISFASLQDTSKTSLKFEKRIWQNARWGKLFLVMITALPLFTIGFGFFGYFISDHEKIQTVAFGSIVLGVGLIGFLKVAVEVFEKHRDGI